MKYPSVQLSREWRIRNKYLTSCHTVFMTSCVSGSCPSSNESVKSNHKFENWTDYTLSGDTAEQDYIYCYWMCAVCGKLSPTVEPTDVPTYQPTDPST